MADNYWTPESATRAGFTVGYVIGIVTGAVFMWLYLAGRS
jgi:hypothetical protein